VAVLSLSVFHFSTPLFAQSQAFDQLKAAANVEVPYAPPPANTTLDAVAPGLNVYFIDVGQGDSEYIELPNGQNVLIDGGPSTTASSNLAQFLTQKNVKEINNVVLTHPHSDHYSGLEYVFSKIKVDNFYDTQMNNTGSSADETLRSKAQSLGVNIVHPSPGYKLPWGPVSAKVLNSCPQPVQSSDGDAINNCSIVIKLAYDGSSILFMGDAQSEVEATLLQNYASDLPSDVLKVGHHGSKYSSTSAFINAVHPKRAYIEVGKNNNYGHPAQSTLDTLTAIGAKVFRTDQDGTQEFSPATKANDVERQDD
jgi:beta-lactamase superfamily II metal-dependent hydrolase